MSHEPKTPYFPPGEKTWHFLLPSHVPIRLVTAGNEAAALMASESDSRTTPAPTGSPSSAVVLSGLPPPASGHASAELRCLPSSRVRTALLNFSSQWFLIPQGSGITAIILHQLDYQFRGLQIISYAVWAFAIVTLLLTLLVYLVRVVVFPKHVASAIAKDTAEAACLSSICISFTSIIQMMALSLGGAADGRWGLTACVLWWINMAMAVVVSTIIPYLFAKVQPPGVGKLSPVILLPMVAAITLAAGGGVVAQATNIGVEQRVPMIVISYLFLGLAIPLAQGFSTVYLTRLFDRSQPTRDKVFQDMILCGPWGQGSFALQSLGQVLTQDTAVFTGYSGAPLFTAQAGIIAGYGSMFVGFVLWGQGLFWWSFATISIIQSWSGVWGDRRRGEGMPQYSLCAWSLVFPWGVFTNAAVELGKLWDSTAFKVCSTALAICLVITLLVNLGFTIMGLVRGSLLGFQRRVKGHRLDTVKLP